MELEKFVNDHPDETRHQAFKDHYKGIKRVILPLPRAPPSSRVPGVPGPSSSGPSVQHAHTTETHLASSGVDMGPSSKVLGKQKQVDETPVQVRVDPESSDSLRLGKQKPGPSTDPTPKKQKRVAGSSSIEPTKKEDYRTLQNYLKRREDRVINPEKKTGR